MSCLNETLDKCLTDQEASRSAQTATFDCSICLDFAADPVVTLCGHLYCWPCIYKWLTAPTTASPQQCPVCKAPVSENALVPLYGRGSADRADRKCLGIPNRPNFASSDVHYVDRQPRMQYYPYPSSVFGSTAGGVLGALAIAVHPLVSRNSSSYLLRPYRLDTIGTSPMERRREMRVEESLRQIWMFLLCCAVLCLLFF